MDVTSLYTNIPHDGIAACRKIWEQRTVQEPPLDPHKNVGIGGCHFGSHSCPIYLKILVSVKSKIVVF
jgi:hypothetical protein